MKKEYQITADINLPITHSKLLQVALHYESRWLDDHIPSYNPISLIAPKSRHQCMCDDPNALDTSNIPQRDNAPNGLPRKE